MSTRIQILKDGVITIAKSTNDRQLALNSLVSTMTANRVLRSNGTNIVLAQVDLTTDVIGVLPPANGGAGSSASYVDLTTNQTIGGTKTFNDGLVLPTTVHTSVGAIWRNGNNLEFRNNANTTQIILNSAGNLSNLADKQVSLNNLVNGQTANRVLRSNGTNVTLSQVALDTDVVNVLSINNGGTGSSTQNFVDITNTQDINGKKYYVGSSSTGVNQNLVASSYSNTNIQAFNSLGALNLYGGSLLPTANVTGSAAFYLTDVEINSGNTFTIPTSIAQQYRLRNFGTGLITNLQGVRLTAANSSTGSVTNLDAGYFLATNSSTGTITTLSGGQFLATVSGGTVTTVNGGVFTASAVAGSSVTTVRGILINASSLNTAAATDCIGLDIASITGTATNKYSLRTGAGRVLIGDTTATTSTTTGSIVTGGGIAAGGAIAANLATSPTGLAAGTFWRNGNVVNIV